MAKILLRAGVHQELLEIWRFIAQDNPAAAKRVTDAIHATFETLAETPNLGKKRRFPRVARDIRSWPVSGFRRYLVLYYPIPDGVQIIHVCHGKRDLDSLFERK